MKNTKKPIRPRKKRVPARILYNKGYDFGKKYRHAMTAGVAEPYDPWLEQTKRMINAAFRVWCYKNNITWEFNSDNFRYDED